MYISVNSVRLNALTFWGSYMMLTNVRNKTPLISGESEIWFNSRVSSGELKYVASVMCVESETNHNIFQLNLNEKVSKQSVVFKSAHNYTIT